MENGWECKKELKSFTAMAGVECINVSLNTLYKAASLKGLSYFVFVTYSYAFGALFLLPFIFIFPRTTGLPPLSSSLLFKIILLSVLGYAGHICAFKGIEYSSPALFTAISNLSPAFIFILAVVFRMETLDFRSKGTQAKTVGTVVSISGALIAILYNGSVIWSPLSSPLSTPSISIEPSLRTSSTNWIIGGLVLFGFAMFNSLWYILQTQIIKSYPCELIVVVLFSLFTSIIAATVTFVVGTDPIAWTLRSDMALLTIALFAFFGPSFSAAVHTWGLNIKGPVYVAIFRPFSFFIASAMGVIFLGDVLYLGSVIGATILLLGFYAVIWGKAKEDQITRDVESDYSDSSEAERKTLL